MKEYTKTLHESTDDISQLVAQKFMITKGSVFPFVDVSEFLTELLATHECEGVKLRSVGLATPEIEIAADKAGFEIDEIIGKSIFSYSLITILEQISNGDIIYLANPNKITGANFSISGLQKIAEKNRDGLIILDEYYFDFFGISGLPLLSEYSNVVILRSFTAPFGVYSSDAGYMIASHKIINRCKELMHVRKISSILRKTILASMVNDKILSERMREMHDESLRITNSLTAIGVQCRITATDFILLRVGSPKDVGNFLAAAKVDVENLDGYPRMKHYIRYRIESLFSNNRLIRSFEKMPQEFYNIKSIEKQKTVLHRPHAESVKPTVSLEEIVDTKIKDRETIISSSIHDKQLFEIVD